MVINVLKNWKTSSCTLATSQVYSLGKGTPWSRLGNFMPQVRDKSETSQVFQVTWSGCMLDLPGDWGDQGEHALQSLLEFRVPKSEEKRNKTSISCVPAFVSGTVIGTLHKRWMKYTSVMNIIGPTLYSLKEHKWHALGQASSWNF